MCIRDSIKSALAAGDMKKAQELCDKQGGSVANVVTSTLSCLLYTSANLCQKQTGWLNNAQCYDGEQQGQDNGHHYTTFVNCSQETARQDVYKRQKLHDVHCNYPSHHRI